MGYRRVTLLSQDSCSAQEHSRETAVLWEIGPEKVHAGEMACEREQPRAQAHNRYRTRRDRRRGTMVNTLQADGARRIRSCSQCSTGAVNARAHAGRMDYPEDIGRVDRILQRSLGHDLVQSLVGSLDHTRAVATVDHIADPVHILRQRREQATKIVASGKRPVADRIVRVRRNRQGCCGGSSVEGKHGFGNLENSCGRLLSECDVGQETSLGLGPSARRP